MKFDAPIVTENLILEKIRLTVGTNISDAVLREMEISQQEDFITRNLVTQLRARLWGRKITESVVATQRFPLTWWDHFKARFFPAWLIERFPVRTTSVDTVVSHYHACPHLNIATRDEHLRFLSIPECDPTFGAAAPEERLQL